MIFPIYKKFYWVSADGYWFKKDGTPIKECIPPCSSNCIVKDLHSKIYELFLLGIPRVDVLEHKYIFGKRILAEYEFYLEDNITLMRHLTGKKK